MSETKELHQQNLFLNKSAPSESIYADIPAPPQYISPVKSHFNLPIGKFHDPDIFLDAYMRNGNPAMKALCLGGMSEKLRNDYNGMIKIIGLVPEAIAHVGHDLYTVNHFEFLSDALKANPQVYDLLSAELQKEKWVIEAYANGLIQNGCKYLDRDDGRWVDKYMHEPDAMIPVFKYAISEKCDKSMLFSIENYGLAHLQILRDGIATDTYRGDPRNFDAITKYHPAVAFLQQARLEAERSGNMELLAAYELAEAHNIELCIDELAHTVKKNPTSPIAIKMAEAVAHASVLLEQKEGHIREANMSQMPSEMLKKIEDAEKAYYVERGQLLREKIAAYHRDGESRFLPGMIDFDMERAAEHPEMGFSAEEISAWWSERGEDYRQMQEMEIGVTDYENKYKLQHLSETASRHEEMRVGEQLGIDGFDFDGTEYDQHEIGDRS